MSLSIKVSELGVLTQITSDDYIIVNDSGSVTTRRSAFRTLQDFLSGSTEYVGSASFALSSSYSTSASRAESSLSASYSFSSSYAKSASYSLSSSYSQSGSYAQRASTADSVGGSINSTYSVSSSYASSSLSASYSFSSSYAKSASYSSASVSTLSSSYSLSSSYANNGLGVSINGGINLLGGGSIQPYYQWITMWSGSYTNKLQRTGIVDSGVQFNIGKPLTFQRLTEPASSPDAPSATKLTPLHQPYAELCQGQTPYGPWLILSYLYSGGTDEDYTGSWTGWTDPSIIPPGTNGIDRNLRVIPKSTIADNYLDETSIGSQAWTLYNRSSRYFAWYTGGSFFGHNNEELSPGISGSAVMVLANGRLGIGAFGSGSQRDLSTNPTPPKFPLAPLHISASEGSMNDTDTPLVRLDQKIGTAGTIGSLAGWIRVSINGVAYKMPLYN